MDGQFESEMETGLDSVAFAVIAQSGLFDLAWYCTTYKAAPATALQHWATIGWRQGLQPNFYFDTNWYLTYYEDVASTGHNPLVHYIQFGEREGRRPSELFDPVWYRETFLIGADQLCLAHYLRERLTGRVNPNPDFDTSFYLETYADVASAGLDAFIHFMDLGFREDRDPSPDFDTGFYRSRYLRLQPGVNPLLDYQRRRGETGVYPKRPLREATIPGEIARFNRPGEAFEPFEPLPAGTPVRVRALAYYLPQYHPMPENNAWWGQGFTEWTNLSRGMPRFSGHYQPRTPRDLGHYTLDNPETLRRQIDMAQAAGLGGFIFYFYWFNGHRLMEKPLDILLSDRSLDMPFCLMWANENWTRRWDGHDEQVLISQDYRPSEDEDLVRTFGRHFADPRYIRLEGRPVLMIYRPGLIPEARQTIARWRRLFRDLCQEDPILVMGQGFDSIDPAEYGLDAAIEFPPHKLTASLPKINASLEWLDMEAKNHVVSYQDTVAVSLAEPRPSFPLIKTAVPSWDNDARREGRGMVLHGSTPADFGEWVAALVRDAEANPVFGEPIICINAWNEWAEGAYLEPDLHFGSAYLNALSRAVSAETPDIAHGKLLLVGHDAHRHGAQTLLLAIARNLKRLHGVVVEFLLLDGGPMVPDYDAVAPVTVLTRAADLPLEAAKLAARGFRRAIINTVAAGGACPILESAEIATVLLVHELPSLIREKNLTQLARRGLTAARHVVFPAAIVRDGLLQLLTLPGEDFLPKTLIKPQGIYQTLPFDAARRAASRKTLGIPPKAPLFLNVGYADMRKGFDLFLQVWAKVQTVAPDAHLAWAGNMDRELTSYFEPEITAAKATGRFHLLGFRRDVEVLFSAADVFVLTSREDPFPSTVLEALSAGIPTVAFAGSGGIPELIAAHDAGQVVPRGDVAAMADAAVALSSVKDAATRTRRARLSAVARQEFSFQRYTETLIDLTDAALVSLSVAVPNYNYARHLPARLETIFQQWNPVREVLLLDDCSTDDSIAVAEATAAEAERAVTIIANTENSGSVFAQWRRAAEAATGEFIWIAEADDESDPRFLSHCLRRLKANPDTVMAFSDSVAIDQDGTILSDSYKAYYNRAAPGLLEIDGDFAGRDFLKRCLSERNLILNVSGVLWRRQALLAALDRCGDKLRDFKVAGDWYLYADILSQPAARIAYLAEPLNRHRRHQSSVTHALDGRRHVDEIAEVQAFIAKRLKLDAKVKRRQAIYLDEITEQLILH
ncbi:glycoside hydrolase family 99-like domain-containing protein [Acidisoma silvae]|uniref:Glycoside hydrolase family 99-like domain-containing protein n=1 Tax=Acidisoma silvae TaxID=2802396 RepID=A0A963YT86_9PROT|nr:glycoside hydrolase family 99-like domain-containing protein [Acidisoma silvae]MCB8876652.1 glycoside hydrolase family 99-like domain-containing protein [Acidisoma silvae]